MDKRTIVYNKITTILPKSKLEINTSERESNTIPYQEYEYL